MNTNSNPVSVWMDDQHNRTMARMLEQNKDVIVTPKPTQADMALFTGGADVSPILYGERPIPGTNVNINRDRVNIASWHYFRNSDKPMIGICRGAQFLNVMSGGSLWQDVNNHLGSHMCKLADRDDVEPFLVSSTHHQMMSPSRKGKLLAYAMKSSVRKCWSDFADDDHVYEENNKDIGIKEHIDPEVVWYEHTNSLCMQYHPEYMKSKDTGVEYFWELFDQYIKPKLKKGKK